MVKVIEGPIAILKIFIVKNFKTQRNFCNKYPELLNETFVSLIARGKQPMSEEVKKVFIKAGLPKKDLELFNQAVLKNLGLPSDHIEPLRKLHSKGSHRNSGKRKSVQREMVKVAELENKSSAPDTETPKSPAVSTSPRQAKPGRITQKGIELFREFAEKHPDQQISASATLTLQEFFSRK